MISGLSGRSGAAAGRSHSETTRREKGKFMMRTTVWLTLCLLMITCTLPLVAQNSAVTGAVVPRLVNYSGRVVDVDGKPLAGIGGVTFSIYKDQYECSPLWLETQKLTANSKGNYTIQLGATRPEGLLLE